MLDSLPSKCRSLSKYAPAAAAVHVAIHGPCAPDLGGVVLGPSVALARAAGAAGDVSGEDCVRSLVSCPRCAGPIWRISHTPTHAGEGVDAPGLLPSSVQPALAQPSTVTMPQAVAASGGPSIHMHVTATPFQDADVYH